MDEIENVLTKLGIKKIQKKILNYQIFDKIKIKNGFILKIMIKKIPIVLIITKIKKSIYIEQFTENIITEKNINDIIISFYLSKLSEKYPLFPNFFGFQISNEYIIRAKENFDYEFNIFLELYKNNQKILTFIIIHILFNIYKGLQSNYYKGYLIKCEIKNIFIKKFNKSYIEYDFDNKTYNIPTFGYFPIFLNFGSSMILKINEDKKLIRRITKEDIFYSEKFFNITINTLSKSEFDESYDIFKLMFVSFNDNNIIRNNWLVKEYKEQLRIYKIFYLNDYLPNSLTIKKFLRNSNVQTFLNNYLVNK